MSHSKDNSVLAELFRNLYYSYIPNKHDNKKRIILKSAVLLMVVIIIASITYLISYFGDMMHTQNILDNNKDIWYKLSGSGDLESKKEAIKHFTKENSDFKGWITIKDTDVDNPIYQTDNNDYYINYNQKKQRSAYGALFFDYRNILTKGKTDDNITIYGHQMKNGSMFGGLAKYKNLDYYKKHPIVELTTLEEYSKYKICYMFLLNADPKGDYNPRKDYKDGAEGDYVFDIAKTNFKNKAEFEEWNNEAFQRSIIDTAVDTKYGDQFLTLVTCSKDFKDARFVIIARKVRANESTSVDTSQAVLNPEPRYPKAWYEKKKLEYPF